jgi:hypothetical protein
LALQRGGIRLQKSGCIKQMLAYLLVSLSKFLGFQRGGVGAGSKNVILAAKGRG